MNGIDTNRVDDNPLSDTEVILLPITNASGCQLAHSHKLNQTRYKKGHILSNIDCQAFEFHGITQIYVLNPDLNWVDENIAADKVAQLINKHLPSDFSQNIARQGRVDFTCQNSGYLKFSTRLLIALNQIVDSVTVLSVENQWLKANARAISIKIIPICIQEHQLNHWLQTADDLFETEQLLVYTPTESCTVQLVLTQLPGLEQSKLLKTEQKLIEGFTGFPIDLETSIISHEKSAIAEVLNNVTDDVRLVMILGASASISLTDVPHQAISDCGGEMIRYGLPVEPGNLVSISEMNGLPVITLPGSMRAAIHEKIFQLIIDLAQKDRSTSLNNNFLMNLNQMAYGGIRDQPLIKKSNLANPLKQRVLVLAAGQSSRFQSNHKLLAELKEMPILHHSLNAIPTNSVNSIHLVLDASSQFSPEIQALAGPNITIAYIPLTVGMGHSISQSIAALPLDTDWIWILPADMPFIGRETWDTLVNEAARADVTDNKIKIIRPKHGDKYGHPVGFHRRYFSELRSLKDDNGAKQIIERIKKTSPSEILEFAVDNDGILIDIDSEATLAHYQ